MMYLMKPQRNAVPLFAVCILAALTLHAQHRPLLEEIPPEKSGISWVHENAMSPDRYLPETIGPGVAFLDFNGDGWMDIYLVNSGPADFFTPESPLSNALYENNGDGSFTDITEHAGVAGSAFGMGVAAGDYDNDGAPDIYVTGYGGAVLYRNRGDGTFVDVTDQAGIVGPRWTTSAVWFDYDQDALLDLFACSFVRFGLDHHIFCGDNELGRPHYCIPTVFEPTSSVLFRNEGNGSFSVASKGTAIEEAKGKGLGVVATDINNDRRMDLFVANDTEPNFLFANREGVGWEEIGLWADVAYDFNGKARSGMGVDSFDIDGDGWQDLFVANVDAETFSLYMNRGDESFIDAALGRELGRATKDLSGWGLRFFDIDRDGEPELLLANGHPDDMIEFKSSSVTYEEPLLLFRKSADGWKNVSADAGPVFQRMLSARGLATGDYDNDGRLDVLVTVNGGAPLLLRNNDPSGNHWIGILLQGMNCNRDAIGARIRWSAGGTVRSRLKTGGGSYLSTHDPREILGLGTADQIDWIEIQWPAPSTVVERFTDIPIESYVLIVEGQGQPVPAE